MSVDIKSLRWALATTTFNTDGDGRWYAALDRNGQQNIYDGDADHWVALLPHQCVASIEREQESRAALIVAAVNALPTLLDELEELRARVTS